MALLHLPPQPSPTEARAFWVVTNAALALLIAGSIAGAGLGARAYFSLLIPTGLLVAGWVWPAVPHEGVRAWNRFVEGYVRIARRWVLWVAFYIVMFTTGIGGSRLTLTREKGATHSWVPRRGDPELVPVGAATTKGISRYFWIQDIFRWGKASDARWTWGLLPFFILASLLEQRGEDEPPEGIYTLF